MLHGFSWAMAKVNPAMCLLLALEGPDPVLLRGKHVSRANKG